MDRDENAQEAKLSLSWEAPLLVAGGLRPEHNYIVRVRNSCYNARNATCAEIRLREDSDVSCSVYLDTQPTISARNLVTGGIAAVDNFNTAVQRRYSEYSSIVLL